MDYLETLLRANDGLWQPPQRAAAGKSAEDGAAAPVTGGSDRRSAKKRLLQERMEAFAQSDALAARLSRAQTLRQPQTVRTEQRGTSFAESGGSAVQTVYLPSERSYEDISRFFERDARRYG